MKGSGSISFSLSSILEHCPSPGSVGVSVECRAFLGMHCWSDVVLFCPWSVDLVPGLLDKCETCILGMCQISTRPICRFSNEMCFLPEEGALEKLLQ